MCKLSDHLDPKSSFWQMHQHCQILRISEDGCPFAFFNFLCALRPVSGTSSESRSIRLVTGMPAGGGAGEARGGTVADSEY